jgi:hypothetical protein
MEFFGALLLDLLGLGAGLEDGTVLELEGVHGLGAVGSGTEVDVFVSVVKNSGLRRRWKPVRMRIGKRRHAVPSALSVTRG